MIPVVVKFKSVTWFPFQKRIKVSLPTSWREVSETQFEIILKYLGKKSDNEFIDHMIGISRGTIQVDCKYRILAALKWIHKTECDCFIIKSLAGLAAPDPGMTNLVKKAFFIIDRSYFRYRETNIEKDLNLFVASLYSPNEVNGFMIDLKASCVFGPVDLNTKKLIAVNYGMVREWLVKRYPRAFYLFSFVRSLSRSVQYKQELPLFNKFLDMVPGILLHEYLNNVEMLIMRYLPDLITKDHNLLVLTDSVVDYRFQYFSPEEVLLPDGSFVNPLEN